MSREEVLDVFNGSYSQVEHQNEISGYTNKITEMINFFENEKHRRSLIPVESLNVLYIDCMNDLEVWMFAMGDLDILIFDVLVIERLCEVVEQAFWRSVRVG